MFVVKICYETSTQNNFSQYVDNTQSSEAEQNIILLPFLTRKLYRNQENVTKLFLLACSLKTYWNKYLLAKDLYALPFYVYHAHEAC